MDAITKNQMIPGRRAVLRIAAVLGTVGLTRLLTAGEAHTPGRPATEGPPGGSPAAGPRAAALPRPPSSYRLSPMTDFQPPEYRPAKLPVRREPLLELPELGRSMVLTFDDGPDPRYTPGILKTLRRHDVRAMFFVCGGMATGRRDLLREIADDGHIVGNHSWSHPELPKLRPGGIRSEMERTSEVIERTLGRPPAWFRAPYGAWNRHTFEIGADLGMEPLAWSLDTLDWESPGTGKIVRRVIDQAAPGAVVLSHDAGGDRSQSVAALRDYLPRLLRRGYGITVPRP
ncbi:polysaccharide deacetylase family protein [Streptomyces sp. NBC_01716]|uniref:polysaccharide deacetylase family protein n=1 Tax=Streptomyces sp. NBC_01716 TaxID=2975917 RepID=UPI002E2EE941|nr:polysaccharide deacetylase family protein [Streptomyces sp. NBC_01716]